MAGKAPTKDAVLRVRLTEHEDKKLRAYAARHQRSISWVVREYIRRLPRGKDGEAEGLDPGTVPAEIASTLKGGAHQK